jgi:hypothetical protein
LYLLQQKGTNWRNYGSEWHDLSLFVWVRHALRRFLESGLGVMMGFRSNSRSFILPFAVAQKEAKRLTEQRLYARLAPAPTCSAGPSRLASCRCSKGDNSMNIVVRHGSLIHRIDE